MVDSKKDRMTGMADNTRIAKVTVYLEKDLYVLGAAEAKSYGISMSAWLRKTAFDRLLEKGRIDQETLVRLAAA